MANPRQRRKAKSSTHKAVSHSKRAKRLEKKMPVIRGPKVLQDVWDVSKTLRQNYLAMGLVHDLNPISSGGTEVHLNDNQSTTIESSVPQGFGRLIRDGSGQVVDVDMPNEEEEVMTTSELRIWVHDRTGVCPVVADVVRRERHSSVGESVYLERLVNKYGDDTMKMARDRRLNPEQRTENELKRAMAKGGAR